MNQSKPCSKCGVTQPLENFRRDNSAKDGRQSACKPCQRKVYEARAEHYKAKSRAYRAEHLEETREKQRDYFRSRAEWNRQKVRIWRANNYQKASATRRDNYVKNREARIEYNRKWRKENPEKYRSADNNAIHRRRARLKNATTYSITPIELSRLRTNPCVYCGSDESIELDHVIPIVRGGSHSIGNLVSACASCNRSKGGLLVMEWRKRESPRA